MAFVCRGTQTPRVAAAATLGRPKRMRSGRLFTQGRAAWDMNWVHDSLGNAFRPAGGHGGRRSMMSLSGASAASCCPAAARPRSGANQTRDSVVTNRDRFCALMGAWT